MRDVIDRKHYRNLVRTITNPCSSTPVSVAEFSRAPGFEKSARAEITKSNHVSPTAYGAYRIKCTPTTPGYGIWTGSVTCGTPSKTHPYTWEIEGHRDAPPASVYLQYQSFADNMPNLPSSLVARARNNALAELNDSKVDLGQTAGEISETGAMMAATLARLIRGYLAARRYMAAGRARDFAAARKALGLTKQSGAKLPKRLGSAWLELQWGWRPLMNDLYNASEAINDAFLRKGFTRIRKTTVDSLPVSSISSYQLSGALLGGVEIGMNYQISDASKAGMSALGLTNPLSLAWELLPLSVVVDWFISVGSFLNGLGAHHGLTLQSGYETHFVRGSFDVVDKNAFASYYTIEVDPVFKIDTFAMERFPLLGFPSPGISFNANLNLNQVANLLALAAATK